jgi:hypothetical protein
LIKSLFPLLSGGKVLGDRPNVYLRIRSTGILRSVQNDSQRQLVSSIRKHEKNVTLSEEKGLNAGNNCDPMNKA